MQDYLRSLLDYANAISKLAMSDTTSSNRDNLLALTKAVRSRMPMMTKYSVNDTEIRYRWRSKITQQMVQATQAFS